MTFPSDTRLGPRRPFTRASIVDAPNGPGVMVVYESGGSALYVGFSRKLRERLVEHLSGDRSTSALRRRLGDKLDGENRRTTPEREITAWLSEIRIQRHDH